MKSFSAIGHAGGKKAGENIPCAAATALLRTAARLLASVDGLLENGSADEPGQMSLAVSASADRHGQWLAGVTDFLLKGLNDLAREYPREIFIRIDRMPV